MTRLLKVCILKLLETWCYVCHTLTCTIDVDPEAFGSAFDHISESQDESSTGDEDRGREHYETVRYARAALHEYSRKLKAS